MGKKVRCPKCQTLLLVPAIATPVQPAPDPLADLDAYAPQPTYRPPVFPSAPGFATNQGYGAASGKSAARGLLTTSLVAALAIGMLAITGLAIWLVMPMLTRSLQIEDSFAPLASSGSDASTASQLPTAMQSEAAMPTEVTTGAATVSTATANAGRTSAAPENTSVAPVAPLAPVGRNPRETAMLAIAEKFVRHARQNEHHEAVAMIDTKLFHARLYGPKGSYEAMTKDIPTAKLLGNFANYALDGAPVGGHRHWQIVGTSQFDGNPGVVLRYYVEPQSPSDALMDAKLFNRLGALVSYDQMTQKAGNLFTSDGQKGSHFDQYRLSNHAISRAFPTRAGYMMLVFDAQDTDPKLVDLVNVLGQAPLSRTGAHVFLADYHTFGGFGSRETYGTKPSTMTLYGLSANTSGATWNPNEPGAKERAMKLAAEATAAEAQKRPMRLEKLVEMWYRSDAGLQSELDRFRRDFPNDLGFELAVVCQKMAATKPTFTAPQDQIVIKATKALYQQWRDPFFQYVEALYESQNGRRAEADALFAKCLAAGFLPTDYYISRIESALDRGDSSAILATLEEWNRLIKVDGLVPDKDRLTKLASRYEALEKSMNPEPSLSEMMAAGMRGPFSGSGGRPGGRPGMRPFPGDTSADPNNPTDPTQPNMSGSPTSPPGTMAQPGQFPMGPPPGFGQPPGDRSASPRQTPPRMPELPGPHVVIKISSSHAFDGNPIVKKMMSALSANGHQYSQSGQTATLKILFAGPMQQVIDAIDFGKVSARDEATRTIEVTIP